MVVKSPINSKNCWEMYANQHQKSATIDDIDAFVMIMMWGNMPAINKKQSEDIRGTICSKKTYFSRNGRAKCESYEGSHASHGR